MDTCDFCKLSFPHAEPNAATHEGKHPVLGWVFSCKGHKGRLPVAIPLFEEPKKVTK